MKQKKDEWTLKKLRAYSVDSNVLVTTDSTIKHYEGTLHEGKPHGTGIALFHNGERYGGQWRNGLRDGVGVWDSRDEGSYDGEWISDKYNGQGKRVYSDGSMYIGEWSEGFRHGTGTLSTKEYKYEGPWDHGRPYGANCRYTSLRSLPTMPKMAPTGPCFPVEFFAERVGGGIKSYEGAIDLKAGRIGKGKTESKNGMVYIGDYVNNKRNGRGKCTYENGDRYEGEWVNDLRNGKGTLVYSAGGKYEGEWKDDMKEGHGSREYHTGDKYTGAWLHDELAGFGHMVYRNGDEYKGEWKSGRRHGHGNFHFHKQKAEYTGPVVNGLIHTGEGGNVYGKMKYHCGNVFLGYFVKGEKTRGIMWVADSSVYCGEWKHDKYHGKGLKWCADGSFYYGHWHRGDQNGLGCIRYPDNSEYLGSWKYGVRHGPGLLQHKENEITHGQWEDDEPTVFYEGQWLQGAYHGAGAYTYANGSKYEGIWSEGLKNNMGKILFADKGEYQGGMHDDVPHGHGVLTYPNSSVYAGNWTNGHRHGLGSLFDLPRQSIFAGNWNFNDRDGPGVYYDTATCAIVSGSWAANKLTGSVTIHFEPKLGGHRPSSAPASPVDSPKENAPLASDPDHSNDQHSPAKALPPAFHDDCEQTEPVRLRTALCEYVDGCEASAVMPKLRPANYQVQGTQCKNCKQAFGMTRWKYLCAGCKHAFCTTCLKDCKYRAGFA
eukprot:gene15743-24042_t